MVRRLRPKLDKLRLGVDTVEERKADLGNAVQNVNQFLSLGGFIALMLGAIGIASAIHVHVQQKTPSVAVLRCLGCTISQTFAIYLLQAIALGVIGAVFGASLGILIQYSLPRVAADFLPFRMVVYVAWPAVLRAMAAGFAVCLIFALFPLISLRRVSPLAVLRSLYESRPAFRDPMQWTVTIILAIGILLLAKASTVRWSHAIGFTAGLAGAFLALAISAEIIRATARGVISPAWPYIWRQGMANLYRPHNRTLLLLLSLGLGAFLVLTLYRTHQLLSGGLLPQDRENQPNTALFDIQADQTDGVKQILQNQKLPVLADVPLVTMRLASVKGVPVRQLLRDRGRSIPRWALRREYRSTYRNTLDSSEHLVKGRWPATAGSTNVIPVSIEEGIARDLKVDLGDQIVFDVQGVLFTNEVASIRRVDWKRIQPNFFMVFPTGILEQAPGFHIVTTRVTNRVDSAAMQRRMVEKFPNVSVIDLTLVLDTIDAVLTKVSFVVRFMASFTVITGIVVLIASVLTGRYQRIQESILLRTLGASRQQVQRILLIEYLLLGLLSALTGVLLAEAGAWGLAKFLFKVPFHPAFLPALIATVLVVAVTILTGLLANRGVLNSPPLEVLRSSG
jgi:putative ABC transport system permease protein